MTESRAGRIGRRRAGGFTYSKPDGGQRPLAVAALEDKFVQRAVADVLNAIYEEGLPRLQLRSRPGRGAHDALDALSAAIYARKVNYIVERRHCGVLRDQVSKEWLARSSNIASATKRVLRLIQKWLRAGVLEDGRIEVPQAGNRARGAAISRCSPMSTCTTSSICGPSAGDGREAKGDMVIVRYADDHDLRLRVGDRRPPLPGCVA